MQTGIGMQTGGLGVLAYDRSKLTKFQIQLVQLGYALSQKKDVEKILEYLHDIRDNYYVKVETLAYLDLYPSPEEVHILF